MNAQAQAPGAASWTADFHPADPTRMAAYLYLLIRFWARASMPNGPKLDLGLTGGVRMRPQSGLGRWATQGAGAGSPTSSIRSACLCGGVLASVLSALTFATGAGPASAKVVRLAGGNGYEVIRACAPPRLGHRSCLSIGRTRFRSLTALSSSGSTSIVPYGELPPGTVTPADLRAAYSLPAETAASHLQTIAITDAGGDGTAEADLAAYDKQFGLPPCTKKNGCLRKVNQEGNAKPLPKRKFGWVGETALDLEMAHAICQSCRLLLVEANGESSTPEPGKEVGDLELAVDTAARLGATEISNSWVEAEALAGESKESPGGYPTPAESAAFDHPGVAITAGSGDCGYLNEGHLFSYCPEVVRHANFPASSPDVVGVGGTKLAESGGTWSATAWSDAGSGCSIFFTAPLWQSAVASFSATGCESARAVADVSATASEEPGVAVYLGTPLEKGEPVGWYYFYGTSVATPIVAAEFGLAGGSRGVEYPAATLYSHAGESSAFYDVTSGSNGSCAGATICNSVAGYDGPSGLGSPIGLGAFSVTGSPESILPPTVSGIDEPRQTLTLTHGTWSESPAAVSDQWAACDSTGTFCAPIAGATGASYALTRADLRHTVRVQESASNASGTSAPTVSVQSEVVHPR
jgi:hypothetical protein